GRDEREGVAGRPGALPAGGRDRGGARAATERLRRRGAGPAVSAPHRELGPPPPLPEGGLRVTPLGGLGAIGRNMTVFEYDGRLLIVDCGVLFPDMEQPGVDLILP